MHLLPAAIVIVAVAVVAGAVALAAFFWALRTRQFSAKHMNEGAYMVFDSMSDLGKPTDQIFDPSSSHTLNR